MHEVIINYRSELLDNPYGCNIPFGIEEDFTNKKLIKIVDILGRETHTNGLNIEIYNDGSVSNKYIVK